MQDYRFSPFQNVASPVTITNELHAIPTNSPFEIRLAEVPVKDNPSSMSIRVRDIVTAAITTTTATSITVMNGAWFAVNNVITIDSEQMLVTGVNGNTLTVTRGYNGTTPTTHVAGTPVYIESSMIEVSATPQAGQYWPDYSTGADNDPAWNTGTVQFNSADAGKIVAVTYRGMGTLVDSLVPSNLPWHLRYVGDGSEGDFISTGDSTLYGDHWYNNFILQSGHTISLGGLNFFLTIRCRGLCVIRGTINAMMPTDGSFTYSGTGGGAGGASQSVAGKPSVVGTTTVATSGQSVPVNMIPTVIMNGIGFGGWGGGTSSINGGAGGGAVRIIARELDITGTINCNGNSGGTLGGGGGGSCILAAYRWIRDSSTITVAGGSGYSAGGAGWYKKLTIA